MGRSGQGLEFAYGVHCRGGQAVDHVAEQTGAGRGHAGHTNGGVGRSVGGGVVVVRVAIGCGEDRLIGVHDGLDFCGGVGQHAGHVVAVQSIVDGGQVGGGDAGDAGGGVNGEGRRGGCGVIVLGCGLDGVQGRGVAGHGRSHHGLQLSARIDAGAVIKGVGNGLLHGGQVVGGHAGDAQGAQLGLGGRSAAAGAADHRLGRSGQGLELGYGVDCRRGRGVDHIAEQTGAGGARQAGHTNGGEGRGTAQGAVIVGRAVGCAQDGLVRVDDGLDFCGGVGQRTGHVGAVQSIVDGGQVGGGDTDDAGLRINRGVRAR